jgi:hypothetical protein
MEAAKWSPLPADDVLLYCTLIMTALLHNIDLILPLSLRSTVFFPVYCVCTAKRRIKGIEAILFAMALCSL